MQITIRSIDNPARLRATNNQNGKNITVNQPYDVWKIAESLKVKCGVEGELRIIAVYNDSTVFTVEKSCK